MLTRSITLFALKAVIKKHAIKAAGSWREARVNRFSEAELNMSERFELFMSWKRERASARRGR